MTASVEPQVSGVILRRLFVEGSDVRAGQPLYQIDPAPYKALGGGWSRPALRRLHL